jgi:hypothetical protein
VPGVTREGPELARCSRVAGFPAVKTLDGFDFGIASVTRDLAIALAMPMQHPDLQSRLRSSQTAYRGDQPSHRVSFQSLIQLSTYAPENAQAENAL